MIDEIQGWREYRADLTLEEIRGLEEIEVGLSRLFPGMRDNHYRSTLLPQIACDRAELNRVTGTKPADDMPIPAGATAGPWEWDRERGARWQRRLTWMRFEPHDYDPFFSWSVSVQGVQYADGHFTKVISAIGARELTPDDARTMATALGGAADLIEELP